MKKNLFKQRKKPRLHRESDSEILIKNLVFFLAFCTIIALCMNFFVLDLIKNYKRAFYENKNQRISLGATNGQFTALQGGFKTLLSDNDRTISSIKKDVTIQDLAHILNAFFYDMNISVVAKTTEQNFEITEFLVKSRAKNLKSLIDFFTFLRAAPLNLRVVMPFSLKKQDEIFIVNFHLQSRKTIYKLQK